MYPEYGSGGRRIIQEALTSTKGKQGTPLVPTTGGQVFGKCPEKEWSVQRKRGPLSRKKNFSIKGGVSVAKGVMGERPAKRKKERRTRLERKE